MLVSVEEVEKQHQHDHQAQLYPESAARRIAAASWRWSSTIDDEGLKSMTHTGPEIHSRFLDSANGSERRSLGGGGSARRSISTRLMQHSRLSGNGRSILDDDYATEIKPSGPQVLHA